MTSGFRDRNSVVENCEWIKVWYYKPVPALKQQRQGDQDFKANLGYEVRSRPAWATCDMVSKKKKKKVRAQDMAQQLRVHTPLAGDLSV